jgi:molybdate transport system substrate-binding protein
MTIRLLIAIATLLTYSGTSMAQVKVIISGGFSTAYRQLLPEFEKATGISVTTGSGASQGKGPTTIASQLERGAPFDVVIMSREGLSELMAAGRILAGSDVDLATAALGAAVRAGAPKPDVTTVEGFKRALLGAKVVAVPQSTSGIYLLKEVFPKLGIADRINVKMFDRGSQSAAAVVSGEADIAVQPVSELISVQGIDYAGRLAEGSKEADGARRLIQFLASDRAAAAITKNGMEPARK